MVSAAVAAGVAIFKVAESTAEEAEQITNLSLRTGIGVERVQSGQAWQAMGRTNSYAARYLEPAGSRRLPTWTNFDLLGAYTFNFGQGMSVRIEGRVQNVFNTQTALSVVTQQYNDPVTRQNQQPPHAIAHTRA